MTDRQIAAREIRYRAADIAHARPVSQHLSNGDEFRFRDGSGAPTYIGNFTKGLPHCGMTGFLLDRVDYTEWVRSIHSGDPRDFERVRLGPGPDFAPSGPEGGYAWQAVPAATTVRGWESQGAGLTFDLEGPDAQSLTMPPAPALQSAELVAEMAELYGMARCRDVPFVGWGANSTVGAVAAALPTFAWFGGGALAGSTDVLASSLARRRVYGAAFGLQELFRGDLPGERVGPYVSQFLLVGNRGVNEKDAAWTIDQGRIAYGSITIDQRVRSAPSRDYMTRWPNFIDVQNGANLRQSELYPTSRYRFISRGRDLATYVHYDALYEAYLNACLILIGLGAPAATRVCPSGKSGPPVDQADSASPSSADPHILTLVTEVATRALKAVRFQKFNVHRRLRPGGGRRVALPAPQRRRRT